MIDYKERENYIKVVCEGVFAIEKLPGQCEQLLSHTSWKQDIGILFDFSNFDFGEIDLNISRRVVNQYQEVSELLGEGKIGLLMKSSLGFGLGRQFQIISEDKGHRKIEVFSNEQQALEWLLTAAVI